MKKLFFCFSFLVFNQLSWADWVEIGKNEDGTFFVHAESIEKSGELVKLWYLIDFKKNQVDTSSRIFRSTKDQSEYDCKEQRSRTLFYNNYADQMGTGKIVFTMKDPFKWRTVSPGSISSALLKIACGKK